MIAIERALRQASANAREAYFAIRDQVPESPQRDWALAKIDAAAVRLAEAEGCLASLVSSPPAPCRARRSTTSHGKSSPTCRGEAVPRVIFPAVSEADMMRAFRSLQSRLHSVTAQKAPARISGLQVAEALGLVSGSDAATRRLRARMLRYTQRLIARNRAADTRGKAAASSLRSQPTGNPSAQPAKKPVRAQTGKGRAS